MCVCVRVGVCSNEQKIGLWVNLEQVQSMGGILQDNRINSRDVSFSSFVQPKTMLGQPGLVIFFNPIFC